MQEPTEKPMKVLNAILVYQVHLRSLDYLCRSQYLPVVDEPSMGSRCEMSIGSKGFDYKRFAWLVHIIGHPYTFIEL